LGRYIKRLVLVSIGETDENNLDSVWRQLESGRVDCGKPQISTFFR